MNITLHSLAAGVSAILSAGLLTGCWLDRVTGTTGSNSGAAAATADTAAGQSAETAGAAVADAGASGTGAGSDGTSVRSPAKANTWGTPVSFLAADGTGQTTAAGTAVAVAPAVIVRDASGRPVPDVDVTFIALTGGGFVTEPRTRSDASGIARVGGWTVGLTPGLNQLVARSSGLPEVTFVATGTPAPGSGALSPVAGGDNQTGRINTALAVQPSVTVRGADGALKAGVRVTFTVASGGGKIQNASAVSDASGKAVAGVWTLGGMLGMQTLSVSATGYSSVQLRANALAGGVPAVKREVVAAGLDNPWGLAFASSGTLFFSERYRGLAVKPVGGNYRRIYAPADLVGVEQCGMLGIALDPAFDTNRTLYAFMSSNAGGAPDSRVVALVLDAGFTKVESRRDIVTGITYSAGVHCGGGLRFGPDGYLYITTGDTRQGRVPQDVSRLGGKVLRVDRNGIAAPGNNTPAGGDSRIFAYGFRNPQGIDFRPGTGVAFLAEHGPGYTDEVTPLRAGGNGGWDPYCTVGAAHGADYCGYDGTRSMTDVARFPGSMLPVWNDNGLSEGMSGITFLKGAKWLDWNGAIVLGMLAGRRIEVLPLDPAGVTTSSVPLLNTMNIRLRTPQLAPDGTLYLTTDESPWGDEIWRLVPN